MRRIPSRMLLAKTPFGPWCSPLVSSGRVRSPCREDGLLSGFLLADQTALHKGGKVQDFLRGELRVTHVVAAEGRHRAARPPADNRGCDEVFVGGLLKSRAAQGGADFSLTLVSVTSD